jgi:hypothetical protein
MRPALIAIFVALLATPVPAEAGLRPQGVTVRFEPCPFVQGIAGCAITDPVGIAAGVYAPACTNVNGCIFLASRHDRFGLEHEFGHIFISRVLTDADKEWLTPLLGFRPGTPWTGTTGVAAVTTPDERMADAYANCALGNGHGRRIGIWDSGYNYWPLNTRAGIRRYRRICTAIKVWALLRLGSSCSSRQEGDGHVGRRVERPAARLERPHDDPVAQVAFEVHGDVVPGLDAG